MSRRTSEANTAIREAWKEEQRLVSEGKGTRDWTPEQQRSIIDKGKAYDEDGRAFVGHHMKSAEVYPEYQGDPTNIQFLSYPEHLRAHGGNWRDPTNWYYDPVAGTRHGFGDGKHEPCKILALSDPVCHPGPFSVESGAEVPPEKTSTEQAKRTTGVPLDGDALKKRQSHGPPKTDIKKRSMPERAGLMERLKDIPSRFKNFVEKHPVPQPVLQFAFSAVVPVVVKEILNTKRIGDRNVQDPSPMIGHTEGDGSASNEETVASDYPHKRASPREHQVKAHYQRYLTNNGPERKYKEPYSRGGSKKKSDN